MRCRAYVWSKEDLARLEVLPRKPRDVSAPDLDDTVGISAVMSRHWHPMDSAKRNLTGAVKSDGKLCLNAVNAEPCSESDDDARRQCLSPSVQPSLLPAVSSIASALIDLRM